MTKRKIGYSKSDEKDWTPGSEDLDAENVELMLEKESTKELLERSNDIHKAYLYITTWKRKQIRFENISQENGLIDQAKNSTVKDQSITGIDPHTIWPLLKKLNLFRTWRPQKIVNEPRWKFKDRATLIGFRETTADGLTIMTGILKR